MGTRYTRIEDDHDFTLIWNYDQLIVDVPNLLAGVDILIILQDDFDGALLITTTDKLDEEFELAPNPYIKPEFEEE